MTEADRDLSIYEDQDELIQSVREHVAAGGSVRLLVDPVTQTIGWEDVESGKKWTFRASFIKDQLLLERNSAARPQSRLHLAWKFGRLLANNHGRNRVTAAFNHGHDWFDTTECKDPECREYAVEDVMMS